MNKKTTYLLVIIIFFTVFCFSDDTKKIKVTSSVANIRETPTLSGKIIHKAQQNDIFELLEIENKWYKILLPVYRSGDPETGYIHSSIVKIVVPEEKLVPMTDIKPESEKNRSDSKPVKDIVVIKKKKFKFEQEKLFSGFYMKGGVMTSPEADSFGDKWIISLGFDSPIGNYLTWGLEFQPYYRNFSEDLIDLTMHSLASNIFLNVKGGVNPGRFYKPLKFLTLYGGLGIGSALSFSYVDIAGVSGSEFAVQFAWHFMVGGEISLGKMNVIIEFQGVKIVDPDIDPSTLSIGYFMLGLRF